jgi:hypothetical protein
VQEGAGGHERARSPQAPESTARSSASLTTGDGPAPDHANANARSAAAGVLSLLFALEIRNEMATPDFKKRPERLRLLLNGTVQRTLLMGGMS